MKKTAIVGNPNSGKTTLFNGLTGGKQKIGNWPGVTVEKKEGVIKNSSKDILLVDLPGIYSISAHSEDEKVARDFISAGDLDLLINIVDATNLERNLYLTTQLIEMQVPLLVVLNKADIAESSGIKIDADRLSGLLGCPVVMINSLNKNHIQNTVKSVEDAVNKAAVPVSNITYAEEIEAIISKVNSEYDSLNAEELPPKWVLLKLIEGDKWALSKPGIKDSRTEKIIKNEVSRLEAVTGESPDIVIADSRYNFISNIAKQVVKEKGNANRISDRIDRVILNRILGIPIFLIVMYLLFWITITIGGAFIDFFDVAFGTVFVDGLAYVLEAVHSPEWLIALLSGGIGTGIQTVATFIPIVFVMFFMLSFLEDSGYMARAAFVMDRLMRAIGLPGKAFIPMIVGFGCTVPAIMGARTLESKKDRLLTIFMTPFMSCGAKLPVYVLFAAAFFPLTSGLIVFSLYIAGILLAALTGLILKYTLLKGEASPFIMELPLYNMPRFGDITRHAYNRLKVFMLRASKVIIAAVFVLSILNSTGTDGSFGNEDTGNSVLSAAGKKITTVFIPMGVEKENWPASVSIFTGLFAKEAVVGTLNSLYGQIDASGNIEAAAEGEDGEEEESGYSFFGGLADAFISIKDNLSGVFGGLSDPLGIGVLEGTEDTEAMAEEMEVETQTFARMRSYFNNYQAYAYLLFILIYFPCVAAFGAMAKETGLKLAVTQAIYMTVFGWIIATLFYQISFGHQALWIVFPLVLTGIVILALYILGKYDFAKIKS